MKKISRFFLFGALILMLLTAACAAEEGTTPTGFVETDVAGVDTPDLTGTPFDDGTETPETATTAETPTGDLETQTPDAAQVTATGSPPADTTHTPGVPVTGVDVILIECQFCIDTWAYAMLVLPDTATFEIVSPTPSTTTSTTSNAPRCSTVEVNNGKQIVLCSGPETTPLVVNICTDVNTCTDFPIDLLSCPLTQPGTGTIEPTQTPGTGGTLPTTTPETETVTPTP